MTLPASSTPLWPVYLRLLLACAIWGASWPWGRVIAQNMPPLTSSALRFLIASVLLLLWLRHSGRLRRVRSLTRAQWLWLLAAASTGIFLYAILFMQGLQRIPASSAVVLITLNPAATLLLAAWLFRERLNGWIALGMALALLGSLTAITHGHPLQAFTGGLGTGQLLILGCVATWAAYTLIGRKLAGVDAIVTVALTASVGSLMLLIAASAIEGRAAWAAMGQAPASAWLSLLALAVLATAAAYAWYIDAVKVLGAGNAAGYITLVPLFGMGFSALWLGETLHASLLTGGAIAVLGMVTMHWGRGRG